MFRKALIDLLLEHPWGLSELAEQLDESPRDMEEDLRHLLRSLRGSALHVALQPARCRKCGFAFGTDKLRKPGKCPLCRGTWIAEARIGLSH